MSTDILTTVAALHRLLAAAPELQSIPVAWMVTARDGVNGGLAIGDPEIRKAADLVAEAAGVEVTGDVMELKSHGPMLARFVRGSFGGVEVFFGGYAELEVA